MPLTPDQPAPGRSEAQERLETLVWEELLGIVGQIRAGALGRKVTLSIQVDRFDGGPTLRIEDIDLDGITVARFQELAGPNFQVELAEARLELVSPSWMPDRIPF